MQRGLRQMERARALMLDDQLEVYVTEVLQQMNPPERVYLHHRRRRQ